MKTLTFKVSDDEARHIRNLSKRANLTLSEYLRRQVKGRTSKAASIPRVKCKFTGAMIFGPSPDRPPLNTESVREMLEDFP